MFDFEGGPCLNVGGTIKYLGTDFKILSIKSEKTKIENVSSVVLEVLYLKRKLYLLFTSVKLISKNGHRESVKVF